LNALITNTWIWDDAGFAALREAWNRLADATDPDDIFLRFEWFDAAWQWRKDEATRQILVVKRGTDIVGIAPLVLGRAPGRGPRRMGFLAVPDTQRCDVLCSIADFAMVAAELARALRRDASKWDLLALRRMPRHDRASLLLRAFVETGMQARLQNIDENPYIDLAGGWQRFYSTIGRGLKKANNLAANRIAKAGTPDVRQVTSADNAAQVDEALASVIAISAHSWKQATGTSMDGAGPGAFIARLTEHARREGWLSLWLLFLDREPVAAEYQLVYNGSIHALRSDFRREREAISPGSYLNREMLERLFAAGCRRYLMGPGSNPYKRRWTSASEPLVVLEAYSPSLRGVLWHWWLARARPAIKRLAVRARQPKPMGTAK
jgi:CelD/BcsL family acetyltransferase involved in cellulose biosynthesis